MAHNLTVVKDRGTMTPTTTYESPARRVSLKVLRDVEKGMFAENALDRRLRSEMALSPQDRRLTTELAYGVLRWRMRLDRIVERCAARPLKKIQPVVRDILRLALYQIVLLDRIPDHAAVDQAVVQARRSSGARAAAFVNAVLRKAANNRDAVDPRPGHDPHTLSDYYSHPQWVVEEWIDQFGPAATRSLLLHNDSSAPLVVRVNSLKGTAGELVDLWEAGDVKARPISYAPDALKLSHVGRSVDSLPGYEQGRFVVQDPASQMIGPLLKVNHGDRVLDACAAPGGKTAHLAALAGNRIGVIAVEKDAKRLAATKTNLARLGVRCAQYVQGDSSNADFLRSIGTFDRVLLDPPCTGLGVLRHNPETKYRIRRQDPKALAEMQTKMLQALSSVVRPGGLLLYSVCTISRQETGDVIQAFLQASPEFKLNPIAAEEVPVDGLVIAPGVFRSLPAPEGFALDGFFAARLERVKQS